MKDRKGCPLDVCDRKHCGADDCTCAPCSCAPCEKRAARARNPRPIRHPAPRPARPAPEPASDSEVLSLFEEEIPS